MNRPATIRVVWWLALVATTGCGRSPLDGRGDSSMMLRADAGLPPCKGGLTQCGRRNVSLCYDLDRSKDHCGACGHACAPGIACRAGVCQQVRCQGPPTFEAVTVLKTDPVGYAALGDFDGDGILDLAGAPAYTRPGGILSGAKLYSGTNLLYGAGDGTFPVVRPIDISDIKQFADLDGDAILDLVSIRHDNPGVTVRRGSGKRDVPFGEAETYATSQTPESLLVADVDSDGTPDLVAGVAANLEYWRGQGKGRFEHQATLSSPGGARVLHAADWNADGALDLVFGTPNLHLRYGRGDGTFDAEMACGVGLSVPVIAPRTIVTDLDHDKVIDLVVAQTGVLLGFDDCNPSRIVPVTLLQPNTSDGALQVADLDGDDNLDILTTVRSANPDTRKDVLVHLGNGRGAFSEPLRFATDNVNGVGNPDVVLLVGDMNRDGKLDVFIAQPGSWQVLLNTCQ